MAYFSSCGVSLLRRAGATNLGDAGAQVAAQKPLGALDVELHKVQPEVFLVRRGLVGGKRVEDALLLPDLVHHGIDQVATPPQHLGRAALVRPCVCEAHHFWLALDGGKLVLRGTAHKRRGRRARRGAGVRLTLHERRRRGAPHLVLLVVRERIARMRHGPGQRDASVAGGGDAPIGQMQSIGRARSAILPDMTATGTVDRIPQLKSVEEVYTRASQPAEQARWDALRDAFQRSYGTAPQFIARAPGRVNLIGEHVDFVGFSVFPAAIEKDILMAVSVEQPGNGEEGALTCELGNTSPRFAGTHFSCNLLDPDSVQLVHSGDTRWANYFKVALKGLQPHLPEHLRRAARGTVLHVLVDGSVPPESSLSSSAAMTTCSSIVILNALGARDLVPRKEMAEVAIESERLVGVNSGGMDQSVSIFGITDHAIYVSFVPSLETTAIQLPDAAGTAERDGFAFVVCNTLVASDKKVNGPVQYNLRVVETRMAAKALEHALGVDADLQHLRPSYRNTLRAVSDSYWAANPKLLDELAGRDPQIRDTLQKYGAEAAQLLWMERLVDQHLPNRGLSRAEVEQLTGLAGDAYDQAFLSSFPIRADHFFLHARAKHVYSEALRVIRFRALCDAANAGSYSTDASQPAGVYAELGALMNQSHESLRELYDCSCPELNAVIDTARRSGSLGSRLTGAGWGGCSVHLVPQRRLQELLDALRKEYYAVRYPDLSEEQLAAALFATQPAMGACIV